MLLITFNNLALLTDTMAIEFSHPSLISVKQIDLYSFLT